MAVGDLTCNRSVMWVIVMNAHDTSGWDGEHVARIEAMRNAYNFDGKLEENIWKTQAEMGVKH
jgi:hypothetical protein